MVHGDDNPMRIQQLEIERFGVWEDVSLPFHERGLTVLYGPNEAGKSTLMRFVRGVLYGYKSQDEVRSGPRPTPIQCAGSLLLTHGGQNYKLRRVSKPGTRGVLEINGRQAKDNDPLLKDITGGTSEALFENIFAIGLTELQQLATLSGDEVAQQIYGLSLGPEGEQIFRAQNAFADQQKLYVGNHESSGEIQSLLSKLNTIDKELDRIDHPTAKHSQLLSRIDSVDVDIDKRKRRLTDLQRQSRGHHFLLRVWEPWKKERDLRQQLNALPVDSLDRETLDRLDEVENELADINESRKGLVTEAKRLQKEAEAIKTRPELEQHMCAVQNLHEQSREIETLQRSLDGRLSGQDPREREAQSLLSQLDGHWDIKRLNETDVAPSSMHRLMQQADTYRRSVRKRSRNVKKYKKMTASLKSREQEWSAQNRDHGTDSISESRKALRRKLSSFEELRSLNTRKEHLAKTSQLLANDRGTSTARRELPEFFWWVLAFFVFGGLALFAAGAYAAFHEYEGVAGQDAAWIVGLIYSLMGVSALGTCWTMKEHFSSQEFRFGDLGMERESVDRELYAVQESIDRIMRREADSIPHADAARLTSNIDYVPDEATLSRLRQQILELDRVETDTTGIDELRRKLSRMRQSLQDHQKEVSRARREWTESLRRFGLSETLKVSEAFNECQKIADAKQFLDNWNSKHQSEEQTRKQIDEYRRRVEELARIIEGQAFHVRDHAHVLAEWDREIKLLGERRRERTQLRQSSKEKRREASRLVDKIERIREQRGTLFTRLGVADRGEIAMKLAAIDERNELEKKIAVAHQAVVKIADSEPELAIVEEDLIAFEQSHSRTTLEDLKREIAEIESLLAADHESIGTLRQELRVIEDDRRVTSLRFDREQVVDEIREATEKWCATRLADNVVDELRQRIERDRQPATLMAASEYLKRLTCGKYHKIWTPLGQKSILVDDDRAESFGVEHLSSGTREQVFLSLRLAMIEDFARGGLELPLVLDDVTVNFDQSRTEAAVSTLLDVADGGQQITLFTCHFHLAQLFESQGVEPVWLPNLRSEFVQG